MTSGGDYRRARHGALLTDNYTLVINPERVVHEALHQKTSKFFSFIFRRDWFAADSAYDIRQQNFGFAVREAEKVRQNASLISTAAQYNVPCAQELVNYFLTFHTNVRLDGRVHIEPSEMLETSGYFHKRPALRTQMSDILSNLDLGLAEVIIESNYYVEKETGNTREAKIPLGIHRYGK